MPQVTPPTLEQREALLDLGLDEAQMNDFLAGRPVVYALPTETEPGVAIVQRVGPRLRSGIVAINDPGGGLKALARFRGRSHRVAVRFGLAELELFGAAVINSDLCGVLLRRGFAPSTDLCPDELGGGTVDILTRTDPVRAAT